MIEAGLKPRLAEEGFTLYPVMRVSLTPPQPPVGANRYILSLLLSLEAQTNTEAQQSPGVPAQKLAGMTLEEYLSHDVGTEEKLLTVS